MKMLKILKGIKKGQSLTRILMNDGFKDFTLRGKVVDVGGGRNPDYFKYFKQEDVLSLKAIDGSIDGIDFEKDLLPYKTSEVDTVVLANVLEHVFNYEHLTKEIFRILSNDGQLIGFVPFMINYHPDPHDYFRYTKEALNKIMVKAGFKNVEVRVIGGSSIFCNFNNIMLSLPVFVRLIVFPFVYFFSNLYYKLRPSIMDRFPLGYIFYGIK